MRTLRVSATAALCGVVGLSAWSVYKIKTRTEAEIIAEWSATAIGRTRFNALRAKEPVSLGTYRELLRIGDGTVAAQSAERIAMIGDPHIDIPLLERTLARFAADDGTAERIARSIRQLRARRSAA